MCREVLDAGGINEARNTKNTKYQRSTRTVVPAYNTRAGHLWGKSGTLFARNASHK